MSRTSTTTRLGGIALALVLPMVASCGNDSTRPAAELTLPQLISAANRIFEHTVVVALDLPRTANSTSGEETNLICEGAGSVSTTTFIVGSNDSEEGRANLQYETGTTYDSCVEESEDGIVEINTSPAARGVIGDFTYRERPGGTVDFGGFIVGRVELRTETLTLNCPVDYEVAAARDLDREALEFNVIGDICERSFGFAFTLPDVR